MTLLCSLNRIILINLRSSQCLLDWFASFSQTETFTPLSIVINMCLVKASRQVERRTKRKMQHWLAHVRKYPS